MGMAVLELHKITPRSLFNKLYGHRANERSTWEQTRLQCYFAFSPIDPADPQKKKLMAITDFMPFAWDNDNKKQDTQDRAAALRAAQETWERIDKYKKQKLENN